MLKICVLLTYFGKFNSFFDFWLLSASYNKEIDFFVLSDDDSVEEKVCKFNNVKFNTILLIALSSMI